jgi:hypothetical protein
MAYRCRALGSIGRMTDHDAAEWHHLKDISVKELAPADIPIAEALIRGTGSTMQTQ